MNTQSLKNLKEFIQNKQNHNKLFFLIFILIGFAVYISESKPTSDQQNIKTEQASVDTYIPAGFVLVPIELINAHTLGSLIGNNGGVVDLFLPQEKAKSIKVASKVKLLKAPYNPELYSALVKESDSDLLLSYAGPFVAVIQNPTQKGLKLQEQKTSKQIIINYQN